MKKIFTILLTILILLTASGCCNENTDITSEKAPVIINVPTGNSQSETVDKSHNNINENITETPSIYTEQSVTIDNQNISYCGNKNSKKFHKSTCGALKTTKDENKVYLKDRSDYINQGYVPCKRCNP